MKVNFGPYIYRFTTNSLEDLWYKLRYKKDSRWAVEDDETDVWDERFEKFSDFLQSILNATVNKIQDKRKRKLKVKVDYYDVWGADHTLAMIILPTLKKLKEVKHGSPHVDPEDVPDELKPKEEPGPDNGYTDDTVHDRWDWVLNEMIWAFEQIVDEESDNKFYDYSESDAAEAAGVPFEQTWSKIKIDHEGLKAHNERIKRGTTLFGKYYRGLWD